MAQRVVGHVKRQGQNDNSVCGHLAAGILLPDVTRLCLSSYSAQCPLLDAGTDPLKLRDVRAAEIGHLHKRLSLPSKVLYGQMTRWRP